MHDFTGTYTDKYQLTMAQAYFLKGHQDKTAIFDYFFRKCPFKGGYAIFAGLHELLEILENLHFNQSDIDYLHHQGFHPEFLNYLKTFQFKGTIYSCQEGEVVFPGCPILRVEASIIEAQLIETLLLNQLNFQTLIATKASRVRKAAGDKTLIEFGLRRAPGFGGYQASRASIIGGFNSTSNVYAGKHYHIPIAGTMAHSFIQSDEDELSAFRDFVEIWPNDSVLLVDTYNTLKSGVPNAIKVAKEMQQKGFKLKGIRLDSGDLAYLAKRARLMLDEAGLHEVTITASNQLDEYVIESLMDQKAPIDVFGVGTNLVIGSPDGALDGVYKLAYFDKKPRIKLSENIAKITLPHKKQVYRVLDNEGLFFEADVVCLDEEVEIPSMRHPMEPLKSLVITHLKKEPLLSLVMKQGHTQIKKQSLQAIATYSQSRLDRLPEEYKRFSNPHLYKVGLSPRLYEARELQLQLHKKELP